MARSPKRRRRNLPEGLHIDTLGDRIELGLRPDHDEVPTVAQPWCDVGVDDFNGTCPLCVRAFDRESGHSTAEHVPPFAVGGFVRTRTCGGCNAGGSAAEADLVRWWWAKVRRGRLSTSAVKGERSAGDVLFRSTVNGGFALVVGGGRTGDGARSVLEAAGRSGEVTATFFSLTGSWRVALLKSAYLAACIHLGEVPMTPDAEYVRGVIRSGSFGVRGAQVGAGSDRVPMRVFRSCEGDAARVWVGHAVLPWSGGGVPIFGVGLGRVAFVTWPVPDTRRRALELAAERAA